jgi:glycosyltransferase involved in cell wall biosynthesis
MEREAKQYLESFAVVGFRWRYLPLSLARMVSWLRHGRFDVLHCHLPFADLPGRIAGRLAGIPVVVTTEHGRNTWKPWHYLVAERALNHITDMKICVSKDILEIRRRREGTPACKLVHIPNGVDVSRFRHAPADRDGLMNEFGWGASDPLVISVGRLEAEKNYPVLVRAMSAIAGRHPGLRCLLVGGGSLQADLETLIRSLGLEGAVRLAGRRNDIARLLACADIFVLASSKEGLPVSLLEAMAAAKAVVVSAVGGMPEVVQDGETGLIVPAGDTAALAGAIERLAGDAGLRAALGARAGETAARDFDIARVAGAVAGVYLRVFEAKRRGVRHERDRAGTVGRRG